MESAKEQPLELVKKENPIEEFYKKCVDFARGLPPSIEKTELDEINKKIESGMIIDISQLADSELTAKQLALRDAVKEGNSFEDSCRIAGYSNKQVAVHSMNTVARRMSLRKMIVQAKLGDKDILEEIRWGIEKSKEKKSFLSHAKYLVLALKVSQFAYKDGEIGDAPDDLGEEAVDFKEYAKNNLSEKEAEAVVNAIRGFKKHRESSL